MFPTKVDANKVLFKLDPAYVIYVMKVLVEIFIYYTFSCNPFQLIVIVKALYPLLLIVSYKFRLSHVLQLYLLRTRISWIFLHIKKTFRSLILSLLYLVVKPSYDFSLGLVIDCLCLFLFL